MKKIRKIILLILVLGSINGFTQSTDDCPTCEQEQARYDSINSIYQKHKTQLKNKELLAKESKKDEKESVSKLQDLKELQSNFESIKTQRQEAFQQLELCFSAASPAECKKCEGGKEVNDNGAFCDDGDPCTINDRCVNGVCIGDPVTSNENPDCGGGKGK